MLQVEMTASIRKQTGKGAMRQLRMNGLTPAVVYGAGSEGLALQLETQPFFQQLLNIYRKNAVIALTLDDGTTKHVIVKDVQTDPVKDTLIHADFLEIDVKSERCFDVPIKYSGTAKGCDLGGVLNIIKHTITVEATPFNIPDEFVVDITEMEIGDKLSVEVVDVPGNVKLIDELTSVCVGVVMAGSKDVEEAEEAAEVEAETEVAPEETE